MKLLNSFGPNPRLVRMFMAEKGISMASEDLDLMSITFNLEGGYPELLKFVNLLDRSQRFLIIETITVTPRAQTGSLVVAVKVDTFVREDEARPAAGGSAKEGAM